MADVLVLSTFFRSSPRRTNLLHKENDQVLAFPKHFEVRSDGTINSDRKESSSAKGFLRKWGNGTEQVWLTTVVHGLCKIFKNLQKIFQKSDFILLDVLTARDVAIVNLNVMKEMPVPGGQEEENLKNLNPSEESSAERNIRKTSQAHRFVTSLRREDGPIRVEIVQSAINVLNQRMNIEQDETINNLKKIFYASSPAQMLNASRDLVSQIFGEDKVEEFVSDVCMSWTNLSKIQVYGQIEDSGTFYALKLRKMTEASFDKVFSISSSKGRNCTGRINGDILHYGVIFIFQDKHNHKKRLILSLNRLKRRRLQIYLQEENSISSTLHWSSIWLPALLYIYNSYFYKGLLWPATSQYFVWPEASLHQKLVYSDHYFYKGLLWSATSQYFVWPEASLHQKLVYSDHYFYKGLLWSATSQYFVWPEASLHQKLVYSDHYFYKGLLWSATSQYFVWPEASLHQKLVYSDHYFYKGLLSSATSQYFVWPKASLHQKCTPTTTSTKDFYGLPHHSTSFGLKPHCIKSWCTPTTTSTKDFYRLPHYSTLFGLGSHCIKSWCTPITTSTKDFYPLPHYSTSFGLRPHSIKSWCTPTTTSTKDFYGLPHHSTSFGLRPHCIKSW
eukprot:gene11397-12582_t